MANSESSVELGVDTANVAPVERRNYPGILDNFNPKIHLMQIANRHSKMVPLHILQHDCPRAL